jgi:transcriptional regulator with XRE-family HTH domain
MVATESNLRISRQVGGALRRLRLARRLDQKQVAGRAGVTVSMLSRYEHGRQHPSLPNLVKVLRALDCSAEDFGRHLGPWGCLP